MIVYLVALAIAAIVCYSLFINRVKGLPPGPPPLPLIGNVHQFDVDMDKKFFEWRKQYGKIFTIWMPHPTVVITDHKLLQEHIVKDGDKFSDRINPKMIMKYLVKGEYGLIFNDNAMWREQRRFALHVLRNVGFNNATIQTVAVDYSQEIIAHWKEQGANKQPVDLTMGIMTGVANIIWQQTFGRTLPYGDPLFQRVNDIMRETLVLMAHPAILGLEIFPSIRHLDKLLGSPLKKMAEGNDRLLEIIDKEIEIVQREFNEDEAPKSFAEAFIGEMRKREAKGEDLGTFTHQQLVVACYDMWTAGFETTVTTLRFIIHYMVNNPEVQRKAQAEIDEKVGKRNIQMEDQKTLHYCNSIIQEVQRLANIIAMNFTRMVSVPVNIEGYDIPVGTGMIPEFSIVHMDENEFERPDYFCPERHINESGEFVKDPRITPFSLGKRSCLGEGLARMELFLYFTSFIQHLTFSSATKVPPALNVQIGFTRSPAPYEVLVESRD